MKRRVLAISSQVAFGPVGNSATVPALEAAGFVVSQVPTVILSFHPGHGPPQGFRTPAEKLEAICDALLAQGMLEDCDGVFTGYFADAEQVAAAARFILRLKSARPDIVYFCDPVLGDDPDGLYVAESVAMAIRDALLPRADIIAPNRFELQWLSRRDVTGLEDAKRAARILGLPEVLATSIPDGRSVLTAAISREEVAVSASARLDNVPHGTGDHLAGLYFGERLRGRRPAGALPLAMSRLTTVIAASSGSRALQFD